MNKRITIKEIAKALHYSVSTVSKALNDSYEISDETKEKIKKYAKEHNYKPNVLALNLQNKKTKTIGILIPNILNHFFVEVLRGIEKYTAEKGYNIITCITNESYEKEVATIEMLSNGAIDGIIACLSEETLKTEKLSHFFEIQESGIPLVLYDRVHKDIHCDKVVIDNVKTAYKATRYLMKSNCKNIAFVSSIDSLNVGKFRAKGYEKALTKYGVKLNENLIIRLENDLNLKTRIQKMLDENTVDALFTVDQIAAAISVQVATSKGLKIPEDIAVIGFTNDNLSKHGVIPLTTINQYGEKIGYTSAETIISKIEKPALEETIETIIIKTELIERESTKKLFIKF